MEELRRAIRELVEDLAELEYTEFMDQAKEALDTLTGAIIMITGRIHRRGED